MQEKGKSTGTAPKGAARKAALPKRFYEKVALKDEGEGRASLLLDGKPVRTPGKARSRSRPARWQRRSLTNGVRKASGSILRPCRSPGSPTARSTG